MKCIIRFGLCVVFLLVWSSFAEGKKRYRKRHHKVQMNGWLAFNNDFELIDNSHILLNYARNWGNFEAGALFGFIPENDQKVTDFDIAHWGLSAGALAEWNFLKNKRRINWVPAIGLKILYIQQQKGLVQAIPYLVSKHFISTRTSINIELNYPLQVWEFDASDFYWQGFSLSVGYAYYFH